MKDTRRFCEAPFDHERTVVLTAISVMVFSDVVMQSSCANHVPSSLYLGQSTVPVPGNLNSGDQVTFVAAIPFRTGVGQASFKRSLC